MYFYTLIISAKMLTLCLLGREEQFVISCYPAFPQRLEQFSHTFYTPVDNDVVSLLHAVNIVMCILFRRKKSSVVPDGLPSFPPPLSLSDRSTSLLPLIKTMFAFSE